MQATQDVLTHCHWTLASEASPPDLIPSQWHWLINPHSLTQRLRQVTNNQIEHLLAVEQPGLAYADEQDILNLTPATPVWQRQIHWTYQNNVWICGRTVIPVATESDLIEELKHLGKRPLGDFLFSHPNVNRQPIEICQIAPQHPYYQQALQHHRHAVPYFWSRRSIFIIDQQLLLVAETFLPAFFNFIHPRIGGLPILES
jgi:chorismate lyase